MSSIITAFTSIFLPIILGIVSRTGDFIPAKNRPILQQFAIRITIPALIFSSLRSLDPETAGQFLPMSLGLFHFMAMTWLMLWGLIVLLQRKFKWIRTYRSELLIMSFTGNLAYVCWKLHDLLVGIEGLQRGIFYTAIYWPYLLIFAFLTVLVFGLSKSKALNKKEFLFNLVPIISAVLLGLAAGISQISIPHWFNGFVDSFGSIAIPMIFFCMGLSLSFRSSLKTAGPLFPFLILRLGVWLMATFVMIKMPWFDETSRKVLLINAFAPLGVNPIIVGEMFGMDTEFIANSTIISTVIFLLYIPILFFIF